MLRPSESENKEVSLFSKTLMSGAISICWKRQQKCSKMVTFIQLISCKFCLTDFYNESCRYFEEKYGNVEWMAYPKIDVVTCENKLGELSYRG